LCGAGACVESSSAPAVTWSESTSTASSSSTALVNFTYFHISPASTAPPLLVVHPTSSASSSLDSDRLTSSVTEAATGDTTSRDLTDMNMRDSSVVTNSPNRVSSLRPPASNDSDQTSAQVPSSEFATNISAGVPTTSSGLPDDRISVDDISPSLSATIPDSADSSSDSSVPDPGVTVTPAYFRPSPLWTTIIASVLCLLALVVLLVILVVCLWRARARHKLCWTKHRCYLPVPLFYQNGSRTAAVVLDPSASGSATTVGNGVPAKGPELAPLTCV